MPPTTNPATPGSTPDAPGNPGSLTPHNPGQTQRVQQIGCVAYLNAKPLIEGLEGLADPVVRLGVPSALLHSLEQGEVDIALCPVIDYYRSATPLVIVPVGCIASDGPTHTVRLFSKTPVETLTRVHADTDSHTSVALLRVVLNRLHEIDPVVVPFDARRAVDADEPSPEAMLLIGDKVVNNAPSDQMYPHQLDLGEAWKRLTGLPFVFAVWMAKKSNDLQGLPNQLESTRQQNAAQINTIADRHAPLHGWDTQQARHYLGQVLSYRVGDEQLQAIERFAKEAAGLGLITEAKPLELWRAMP